MAKVCPIILLILIIFKPLFTQNQSLRLNPIITQFKEFEYQRVIELAETLLADNEGLTTTDLCEIYRLKATAHYSLMEMKEALNSFVALLQLDPEYQLNPKYNSPKIVEFFKEIKLIFRKQYEESTIDSSEKIPPINTLSNRDENLLYDYRHAMGYSLILPGLGHLSVGQKTKGWALITASALTLGTGIFYAIETNKREKEYLQAIDKPDIEKKYDQYNQAYKIRNFALISAGLIWLYSQIDLLIFSDVTEKAGFHLSVSNSHEKLQFSLLYQF